MRGWSSGRGRSRAGHCVRPRCPTPSPDVGEVRVRVAACGVCRTDLHLAEGDLPPRRPRTVPGHEIVGYVDRLGPGADRFAARRADRGGLAAQHLRALPMVPHAGGRTSASRRGSPAGTPTAGTPSWPWCPRPTPTGCPTSWTTVTAAPLLCAGIVGYRALRRAELPAGGAAGHLRLRRVRPRRRAGGDRPGGQGARADPRRAGPAAGPRARRRVGRCGRRGRRRSRWTPRSCSRRSATWCRWRCGRWTPAARSRSPASTSATSRA